MADSDVLATAIIFPACIDGSHGIVAACCTEDSMLVVRLHSRIDGGIIGRTPAWLLYECYFFVGMSLLNWSGMTDPTYAANSRRMGLFGDFLNAQCRNLGISQNVAGDPPSYYTVSFRDPYLKGLRELLTRIGVKVWLELSSRCSVLVPGALDVAVRMFAGTYVEPEASQYLLSQRWVPEAWHGKYRDMISCRDWVPQPWDWYQFPVWQCMGQAPVTEYIADRSHDEDLTTAERAYD